MLDGRVQQQPMFNNPELAEAAGGGA